MITFKKRYRYKYTLRETYVHKTDIRPEATGDLGVLKIDTDGTLTISAGYAWDGPSGPTFDTANFMRGSLVHDALYQLMREEALPQSYRKRADEILREVCIEDGMTRLRAWIVYMGVRIAGAPSAAPDLFNAP